MKRIALMLILLTLALALTGCAAVTSENSFQNQSSDAIVAPQLTQSDAAVTASPESTEAPGALPTKDTSHPGYNG